MTERKQSPKNLLGDLLDLHGVLVADGGMGTSLFELGLTSGSSPELWKPRTARNNRRGAAGLC